jgi:hypothetical protein
MTRYDIALNKKAPIGITSSCENVSIKPTMESTCDFCSSFRHGLNCCDRSIELNETITRGMHIWESHFILSCTRKPGHTGPHVACSWNVHNIKSWED